MPWAFFFFLKLYCSDTVGPRPTCADLSRVAFNLCFTPLLRRGLLRLWMLSPHLSSDGPLISLFLFRFCIHKLSQVFKITCKRWRCNPSWFSISGHLIFFLGSVSPVPTLRLLYPLLLMAVHCKAAGVDLNGTNLGINGPLSCGSKS